SRPSRLRRRPACECCSAKRRPAPTWDSPLPSPRASWPRSGAFKRLSGRASSAEVRPALFQQVLLHEGDRGVELVVLVGLLLKAVPFVLADQVPDRAAVLPDRRDHLVRLVLRDAGIVGSLNHEQRFRDLPGVRERRNPDQELAHLRVPLVAVLYAAQVAA